MSKKTKRIFKAIGGAIVGGIVVGGGGTLGGAALGAGSGAAAGALFAGLGVIPGTIVGAIGGAVGGGVTGLVGGGIAGAITGYQSEKDHPNPDSDSDSEQFHSFPNPSDSEDSEDSESDLSEEENNQDVLLQASKKGVKKEKEGKQSKESSLRSHTMWNRKHKNKPSTSKLHTEEVDYQRGIQDKTKQFFCARFELFFNECKNYIRMKVKESKTPDLQHQEGATDAIFDVAKKYTIRWLDNKAGNKEDINLSKKQLTKLYNALANKSEKEIANLAEEIFNAYTNVIINIHGSSMDLFAEIMESRILYYISKRSDLSSSNLNAACIEGVLKGKSPHNEDIELICENGSKICFAEALQEFTINSSSKFKCA